MKPTHARRCAGRLGSRLALAAAALLWAGVLPARAQEGSTLTASVFRRFSDRVVKVHVTETGSGARTELGSGFFVSPDGHLVTNYHVIASLVHEPERYRAELIDATGAAHALTLLALDVVHDLAVLHAALATPQYFPLGTVPAAQGDRLYSLGHPHDLGLTIVEGTFNGLLQHTLYPKIHFTGSINPGMSGGPTITEAGSVVGINVATAGNQVSFLVPVERAAELLARATAAGPAMPGGAAAPGTFLAQVGEQILAYQQVYLDGMFADSVPMTRLGRYRAVTSPAPFFRCWGNLDGRPDAAYESLWHRCSTDDQLFIASEQQSGVVEVEHRMVTSSTLNMLRFNTLYSGMFARDDTPSGDEEHVTSWRCRTRNVRNPSVTLRAVLCVRAYRKLPGLYDGVLKVATLGRSNSGLVSTLTLSGASYDNITALATRYLERIAWQ